MTQIGRSSFHTDPRINTPFNDIFQVLSGGIQSDNLDLREVAKAIAEEIKDGELLVLESVLTRLTSLEARVTALENP